MSEIYGPPTSPFDTYNPETIKLMEGVIERILDAPDECLVPDGWDDEELCELYGIELNPRWQLVPNPWRPGFSFEAAPVISDDENGRRSFTVIAKRDDESIRHVAYLYRLTSVRLLMMPHDPNRNTGAALISWNSDDAQRFLVLSENLLDSELSKS